MLRIDRVGGGAGPALTAILGGHVDVLASGPAVVLPHIKSGKLRALGGWGDRRVAVLPDIPTVMVNRARVSEPRARAG